MKFSDDMRGYVDGASDKETQIDHRVRNPIDLSAYAKYNKGRTLQNNRRLSRDVMDGVNDYIYDKEIGDKINKRHPYPNWKKSKTIADIYLNKYRPRS